MEKRTSLLAEVKDGEENKSLLAEVKDGEENKSLLSEVKDGEENKSLLAEVKDGEENKPAFSLPQCSHHKILDFQLVPPGFQSWISKLDVVDVGMLELKSQKISVLGLNSSHLDGLSLHLGPLEL